MLTCPACGDAVAADDFFCEHCGHALRSTGRGARGSAPVRAAAARSTSPLSPLAPAAPAAPTTAPPMADDTAPCARCGGRLAAGACTACGLRRRSGDHSELRIGRAAGVSDRGLRHERNEDAMALRAVSAANGGAPGGVAVPVGAADPAEPAGVADAGAPVAAVVCDGVSSSPRAGAAATAASRAGSAALAESLEAGVGATEALGAALHRAGRAVTALAPSAVSAPACTFLAAAVPPSGPLAVGWAGDSRAYWVSGSGAAAPSALLTRDDSWSEAVVAMSLLTPDEAARSPRAHALTAWLGADYGGAAGRVATFDPRGAGSLVLCSDGLWNYVPDPVELASLVRGASPDPLAAARACVRFALRRGGRDNVTAVVIGVPGAARAGEDA